MGTSNGVKKQIILASTSPRRREVMKLLKIKFKAVDSGFSEVINPRLSHKQLVKFLALGKAKAAAKKYPSAIIVAADTMVSFRGNIVGKPKNQAEAVRMLESLSGNECILMSGVVVMDAASKKTISTVITNKQRFKKLSSQDISRYIKYANPYDKAGGYNLQGYGLNLLEKIEGNFTNNLGLPMAFVFNALQKIGLKI